MIDGFNAHLQDADIDMAIGNFMDTTKLISAVCAFDMQRLTANLDTIDIDVTAERRNYIVSRAVIPNTLAYNSPITAKICRQKWVRSYK